MEEMITVTPLKSDTISIFARLYSHFWRDYRKKQGIKKVNLKEYEVEAREIAQKTGHIIYLAFYDQNPAGFIHIHEMKGVSFEILNDSGKILISDIDLNNLKAKLALWADSHNMKISIEEGARTISHGTETEWFFGKIYK